MFVKFLKEKKTFICNYLSVICKRFALEYTGVREIFEYHAHSPALLYYDWMMSPLLRSLHGETCSDGTA